jgi:hypothetical protein
MPIRIDEEDADPVAVEELPAPADLDAMPRTSWLAADLPPDVPPASEAPSVAEVPPVPDVPAAEPPPAPQPPERPRPGPAQYPIPPAFADGSEQRPGAVPTWAFRAPSPSPAAVSAPAFVGDLSLDPMSLRRRSTIRSGMSALAVDETQLVLRTWWRRTEIRWADVRGFEPRFDASGAGGRLVAVTVSGPVELPATKRSIADLRYLHALLDAYRQRAALLPGR